MMRIFYFLFLISLNSFANHWAPFSKIIKAHHVHEDRLGLLVLEDGKKWVSLNEEKLLIPASLTKIATAGAILKAMPLNTKFTTELRTEGKIVDGILKGHLCVVGGGDPSFVSEKMWYLVNELTRQKISKIDGDIWIDTSRFDEESFDKNRETTRVDRAFDAPISPMSFNWNSVNIYVRPGDKKGAPALVFIDPQNDYIELENKAKTSDERGGQNIAVTREKVFDHDKIMVTGTIGLLQKEQVIFKSISYPALWAGSHLKSFLSQRGIEFHGQVKRQVCQEKDGFLLAKNESKNLTEMISDMLKFSNNFVAEMLVKNIPAVIEGQKEVHMSQGVEYVHQFVQSCGIKKESYVLKNVSGLTRENRFSVTQIATLLQCIQNTFSFYPEFLSGLPLAGVDGTLKKRLNSSHVIVRAKTGYLDGVVGLAGFIGRVGKSPLIFAFIYNGSYEEGLSVRNLFDDFLNVFNEEK